MADSEGDSLPLLHDKSKKRRLNDFEKCLICQEDSAEALRQAKPTSLATFISAAEARDDSVKIRLGQEIQDLEFKDIFWHAKCYANYTSKTNIMRVKKRKLTASASPSAVCESSTPTVSGESSKQTRGSRSQTPMTDWDKCLFCKRDTYKKDSKLINVASKDGCDTIFSAAEAKGDAALLFTLRGVSKDLVAAEGKSNIKHKTFKVDAQEDSYANTMKCLGEEIAPSLNAGKEYNMNALLQKYKILLAERGIDADSYSRQRLKLRLMNFFGESIVFHQQSDRSKPELVYSSQLSLQDVINAAFRQSSNETSASKASSSDEMLTESSTDLTDRKRMLYQAAMIIKADINETTGIAIQPLQTADLTIETSKTSVPESLYWLLRLIISSEDTDDAQSVKVHLMRGAFS